MGLRLLRLQGPIGPDLTCSTVAEMFHTDRTLPALAVLSENRAGLVDRQSFLLHFSTRFGRELYGKRPIGALMDPAPLIVDVSVSLNDISARIAREKPDALYRGFIFERDGVYAGIGTGIDLMRGLVEQMAETLEDLRQARADLIDTERMATLGSLVAGFAHEINTPLGIAVTAASSLVEQTTMVRQAIETNSFKRSDFTNYMTHVTEAGGFLMANLQRTAELVRSFKQVSVDQSSEHVRRFDLGEYARDVLTSLQPKLRRTPHQLEADLPSGLYTVGDPGALAQVLTNLVMNAIVHGLDEAIPGRIGVSLRKEGTGLELAVSDNGKGIPESVRPHIFDAFYTTRRGSGGSGLGLYLTRNLVVHTLGGTIEVESPPDGGTRFRVSLPSS